MAKSINTQQIFRQLLQNPNDVVITTDEAVEIWKMFRGSTISPKLVESFECKAFLQAANMAAIEGSNTLGWLAVLLTSTYGPSASLKGVIRKLVTEALKNYYSKVTSPTPKIYVSVINAIKTGSKPYFDAIANGVLDMLIDANNDRAAYRAVQPPAPQRPESRPSP